MNINKVGSTQPPHKPETKRGRKTHQKTHQIDTRIQSISFFQRLNFQSLYQSLRNAFARFTRLFTKSGGKQTPVEKTTQKIDRVKTQHFEIHPPGQKPHLSHNAKVEVRELIQGKGIDLKPTSIKNSRHELNPLHIPFQFSKDLPRMDVAIDGRAMVYDSDNTEEASEEKTQEKVYKCCKALEKKYGQEGLKMLGAIVTQALAASLAGDVATMDQAAPIGSKPFWNIRKDRQGHVHVELTLLFKLIDPMEGKTEGYRAVKREIIFLSKKEFKKENPQFNVYEWSSDFHKEDVNHPQANIEALRDLQAKRQRVHLSSSR